MWLHYIWYRIKSGTKLIRSLRPLWLGQERSIYKGGGDCGMQTTSLSASLDAAAHTRKTWGGWGVLAHAPLAAHAQWLHSLSFVNVVCRPHAVPAAHVTVFQTWAQKVGLVLEEVTLPYIQLAPVTIKHLSFLRGALWAYSQVRQGGYPLLPHLRPTMGMWHSVFFRGETGLTYVSPKLVRGGAVRWCD